MDVWKACEFGRMIRMARESRRNAGRKRGSRELDKEENSHRRAEQAGRGGREDRPDHERPELDEEGIGAVDHQQRTAVTRYGAKSPPRVPRHLDPARTEEAHREREPKQRAAAETAVPHWSPAPAGPRGDTGYHPPHGGWQHLQEVSKPRSRRATMSWSFPAPATPRRWRSPRVGESSTPRCLTPRTSGWCELTTSSELARAAESVGLRCPTIVEATSPELESWEGAGLVKARLHAPLIDHGGLLAWRLGSSPDRARRVCGRARSADREEHQCCGALWPES